MKLFIYFVGSLLLSAFSFTQQVPEPSPEKKEPAAQAKKAEADQKKKEAAAVPAEAVPTEEPKEGTTPAVTEEKKEEAAPKEDTEKEPAPPTEEKKEEPAPKEDTEKEPAPPTEEKKEEAEPPEEPTEEPTPPVAKPTEDAAPKEDDEAAKKEKADKDEAAPAKAPTEKVEKKPTPPAKMPEAPPVKKIEKPKPEKAEPTPAKKEEKKPATAKEAIGKAGIDTVDLEGGNWLLKRQSLEKTLQVAEGINELFSAILKTRMSFVNQRNQADKKFETFITEIGIEIGELTELVNSLMDDLEEERTTEGSLTLEERDALEQLEKKLNSLKQMKEDLSALSDLDTAIDDVLLQVEKEIDRANAYQNKAWSNVQEIKKVLNDEKAEELYVKTGSLLKNVNDISQYLSGKLNSYLTSTISTLDQKMNDLKQLMAKLKKDGLDLKKEIAKFIADDQEVEQEPLEPMPKEPTKPAKETGWFSSIAVIWRYPIQKVKDLWQWIMSLFS